MSPPMEQTNGHFDEMTCLLYLDGQLNGGRARDLLAHADACAGCRRLLASLEHETRLIHESLVEDDEPVPARLLAPRRAENVSWAWLSALGIAAAGVYTLWTSVAEPWLQQLRGMGFGESDLLTMLFFSGAFWKGWGTMLNLIEALSIGTLGLLLVPLLRRNLRRLVSLTVVIAALLFTGLILPGPANAAEFKGKEESYVLPAGEVVHTDLVVGGRSVHIDGTVEGDLIAGARTVTVRGHVTGDVIAWAQDIRIEGKVDGSCICGAQYLRINGQVDGNVRGFAQHVTIEGSVAKNLTSWAQTLEIPSRGKVGGGVLAFMAELSYSGRVERDFTAWFHEGDLNGYVGGNALLREGRLTIGPNAEIRGSAAYKGERKPEVSPQAKLANPLSVDIVHHRPDPTRPRFYWSQLLRTAAAFVFGMALLLLMPGFFSGVVKTGDRVVPALAFGTLALVATPVLAVVACVTLVGIPVGIAALFLYATMLYASEAFVGAWLGGKILGPGVGQAAQMGRLALGLVLLRVAFHLPLVKVVVVLYMFLAGLGAIVLTAYERLQVPASGASA